MNRYDVGNMKQFEMLATLSVMSQLNNASPEYYILPFYSDLGWNADNTTFRESPWPTLIPLLYHSQDSSRRLAMPLLDMLRY
jgi:hypothetical protein